MEQLSGRVTYVETLGFMRSLLFFKHMQPFIKGGKKERVPCLLTTCVVIVGMLAKTVDTIGMHVV